MSEKTMVTIFVEQAKQSEKVTTVNSLDGLGIGYLFNGRVWVTTGTVFCILATEDVFPMVDYYRDGGNAYMERARGL